MNLSGAITGDLVPSEVPDLPVEPPQPDPPVTPDPPAVTPPDSAEAPSWFRAFIQALIAWLTAWLH